MNLALEGVKILDLTQLFPGPFATMLLADYGAEVLKVEQPGTGDGARSKQPQIGNESARHLQINRNKKSLTLNLKSPKGKDIFLRLVEIFDVVIEGFRPGVMERLGLDYKSLKNINPKIIYCSLSGYGQDGPYRNRPGHDINYIALSGAVDVTGRSNEPPQIPGFQVADLAGGGFSAALGILIALLSAKNTGKGQYVDVSMLDGVISLLVESYNFFFATGDSPKRGGGELMGEYANYTLYETKDGRHLSVGARESKFWDNLCSALGKIEYRGKMPNFGNESSQVRSEFQKVFLTKTRKEWEEVFKEIDACVEPVNKVEEACQNPQILFRKMVIEVEHPEIRNIRQLGFPIKFSDTPGTIREPAPSLGQHTNSVLKSLGFDQSEIDELMQEGVI